MASANSRSADRSLAGHVTRVFVAVAALTVLTLSVAGGCFAAVLAHYEPAINDLASGRTALQLAHNGMLDQETGLRGYLGTADRTFLQPYATGQDELSRGNAGGAALGTRSDLAVLLLDLRTAQQVWVTSWADQAAIRLPDLSASPGTELTGFLQKGKELFDRYRVSDTALSDRLAADIADQQAAERSIVTICFGLVVVVFLVSVVTALHLRRALRAAVVVPVTDLLATMARIRGGDFAARPKVGVGPPEMRQIAAELAGMTGALVAERDRIGTLEVEARAQADKLRILVTLSREIAGSLSLRYVAHAVGQAATSVSGFRRTIVWLVADDGRHLTPVHDTSRPRGEPVGLDHVQLGDGLVGRAAQFGRTMAAGPDDALAIEHRAGSPVRVLGVPMIVGARVVGVMEVAGEEPIIVDAEALDVLESLAGQAATAIEAARLHHDAQELGLTDALTRLPNRRQLDGDLATEVARSVRYNRPLAFIMLDVDHFKQFNDNHGHQVGDQILAEFGALFSDVLRESDTAYRFGGEEFCVLLRETDGAAAVNVAERLRSRLEVRFTTQAGTRPVTVSLGVASIPDDATDADSLIARADRALYSAKAAGRNRVSPASAMQGGPTLARVHGAARRTGAR